MRPFVLLAVLICPPLVALGQTTSVTQLDPYRDEPIVWEHFDTTIHMRADGTGDRTVHIVARLQSDGVVRELSVLQVGFASAYESAAIDYIRVHKPNGTTIETPVADAIEMPAPVTSMAPLYSDLKTKQLPVRSLAKGDVLEYQLRTVRTKAEIPGQFWGAEHFLIESGVVLSQTLTLDLPADTYVQVWHPNHPSTPRLHDGIRTYAWTSAQLKATPKDLKDKAKIKDADQDDLGRNLPSVAWTTFHSWSEVGNWYRSLALTRSEPTPAIVARANDLTKNAKTPDDQVRALYDYVSKNTRYVGIDFGVGHYQPHAAEEVMSYQYGDCKDKDTLLEALLRAKGFKTAPALIGVNIAPVSDLPSPALFNHVITTVDLPAGRIWLDTTAEVAPYRVLVPLIRDTKALVIPAIGVASLETTPADPPFPYFERFEAVATLDKDGLLKSHMDWTMRSDNEFGFRTLLQRAAPAQWNEAMQSVSRGVGFQGTVTNTDFRQKDPNGPVHLSYDYERPSFADWEHHRILPLFPYLDIAVIDKETAPDQDIDLGAPRTLEAVTRIQLPDGYKATLLDDIHVKRDYANFDQTYRLQNGELVIERKAVILRKRLRKADWKDYNAFMKATGLESGENYVSLNAPGQSDSPGAMAHAYDQLSQGNWEGTRQTLDEVRAKDPRTPYLMSLYGFLAQHDHKTDEAIRDYEIELNNNPNANNRTITFLGGLYNSNKRYTEAEKLLQKYVDRNDPVIYKMLAFAQTNSHEDEAALITLQQASKAYPDDLSIQSRLASALDHLGRTEEAAAMLKKTLLQTSDVYVLNESAYTLATFKKELPLAESSSRRSIAMLETESANAKLEDANDRTFSRTSLLGACWDTLGWILFQENKAAEAEPYLRAAWLNEQSVTIGSHLAQVLEAQGKRSEALTMNNLALATDSARRETRESDEVRKNADRLRLAGAKSSTQDAVQKLQQMRTFHVARTPSATGSGTFHVIIANDRIAGNLLASGPEDLKVMGARLDQLKVPDALPPSSKAQLFRDGILFCSTGTSTCEFVLSPHQFNQR